MIYQNIYSGKFLERPNRFIANVEVDGEIKVCHVKNTGRCREILTPGADVFIDYVDKAERKTKYDLISVYKGDKLINIDSQAPNKIFHEFLLKGKLISNITYIKPEFKYLNSRFDFYIETANRKILIEVKGVTLEEDGITKFPDAPTLRGVRHVEELILSMDNGYEAYVIFIIQMKDVRYFTPNNHMHPQFGEVLKKAWEKGVKILAYDCNVGKDFIEISEEVSVKL